MIRILFIILSLCCTILCAFVAFLSNQASNDLQEEPRQPPQVSCRDLLEGHLQVPARHLLTEFEPGKYFATRDVDENGAWELVGVPFFPDHWSRLENNYPAVIVCLKQVSNRDELNAIVDRGEIDVRYWPNRQTLDDDIHSRLANKYQSLDFSKSIVLHSGFSEPVPVLGSSLYVTSVALGAISMVVGLWNLLLLMFDRKTSEKPDDHPVTNRAGLPSLSDHDQQDVEPEKDDSRFMPV